MTCTHWKAVEFFKDQPEYEAFMGWLLLRIQSREAKPVSADVFKKNNDAGSEKWFRCAQCHTVWRLLRYQPGLTAGSFRPIPSETEVR